MDPAPPRRTEAGAAAAGSLSDAVAALSLGAAADRGEDSPAPELSAVATSDPAEAGAAVGALLLSTPELVEIATAHVGAGDMLPWALACKDFRTAQVKLRRARGGPRVIVTPARDFLSPSRAAWVVSEEVKDAEGRHMVRDMWQQRRFCSIAAELGQLKSLQALRAGGSVWSADACEFAAKNGHLEVLMWLRDKGCRWNEDTCEGAAKGGHLHVLKYLRGEGCPWDEWTCKAAAAGGHLDVLKYLREEGCPWDEWSFTAAARRGCDLTLLRWLREQGCPWDERTCEAAAESGHLDVLKWLTEHGCPQPAWGEGGGEDYEGEEDYWYIEDENEYYGSEEEYW
eukprot:CAMPEP_0182902570 /NCGR_PEP_ID=MMETSP0034_2-20130328/30572_1 /TAXON_ID=156128 /ORGANISM="Nephroselmis pyriformis, Strain CCMP717" /LENGTH=340 /DNA_ID=CAMNT_0025037257 /DNA_START=103 /DNA_END=1125 /DNA_ORIENTATION=+